MGIDPDDALDGVDGREPVCAAAFRGLRRGAHFRYVRRKLGEDGELRSASGGGGEALHQLRHLPDVRAESSLRHVRAGEVQLDRVRAVFLAQACQFLPLRVVLTHDGGQNDLCRVFLLQPPEDLHVLRHTVIGELLDVLEADDAAALAVDSGIARRGLVDLKGADRLEGDARPAGLKGPLAHIVAAPDYRGRKQERVLQRYAAQLCAETFLVLRHIVLQLRLYLVVQPCQQLPDRDLMGADACRLAGRVTSDAGVFCREPGGCGLFIVKPDAAQQRGGVELPAGRGARRVGAKRAAEHVGAVQFSFKHIGLPCLFKYANCLFDDTSFV